MLRENKAIDIDEYRNIRANTYIFSVKKKYCTSFKTKNQGVDKVVLFSSIHRTPRLAVWIGGDICICKIRLVSPINGEIVVVHNSVSCGNQEAGMFWLRMKAGKLRVTMLVYS